MCRIFFLLHFLFRLQRNECADAEKIFFFFLSIVRTVSTEERTSKGRRRRRRKKKYIKRRKMLALTRLSNAYLMCVYMLLKEFRASRRSFSSSSSSSSYKFLFYCQHANGFEVYRWHSSVFLFFFFSSSHFSSSLLISYFG